MTKINELPAVIKAFIKATNDHDGDAYMGTFAKDALVNDFARNFWGTQAIKEWSDTEIIGDKVTFEIDEVVVHYGDFIITALTDGNYDKSKSPDPTYLDYYFSLDGEKIVKLIIIKNKQKSAKLN
jgi:ketosteroid isomerase-like protein